MDFLLIITAICVLCTLFGYINARWMKLPGVVGIMVLSIVVSVLAVFASRLFPAAAVFLSRLSGAVDFSKILLDVMLGFMLFAGALQSDVPKLRKNVRGILWLSTLSVMISALAFATLLWLGLTFFDRSPPFIYCLLFGALISPTDAIAASALLKTSRVPDNLRTIIHGESLFNDGIGIVLFFIFLDLTVSADNVLSLKGITTLVLREIIGGMAAGLIFGYLANQMMRRMKVFEDIVMLSLSLVLVLSVCGSMFHFSVPLAVVCAGLLIADSSFDQRKIGGMHGSLEKIWELLDGLLNTILFLLLGFQMVSVSVDGLSLLGGIGVIAILLFSRMLSIAAPIRLLRDRLKLHASSIKILTWGGLRGGISVALALSLPDSPYRPFIISGSFFIVVFSVVVQGLSFNRVINRWI